MYILLTAATQFEIQPAIDFLGGSPASPANTPAFDSPVNTPAGPIVHHNAQNAHHEIEFLVTGIGSVITTHSLMRHIGRRRPDIILQAGIAGCFPFSQQDTVQLSRQDAIKPGEVLVIREEILADLGVWEAGRFRTLFDLNLKDGSEFPFSNGLLMNPYEKLLAIPSLRQVRGITVNEITTSPARIEWY